MTETDILYRPSRERTLTTNAWAFLHWLAVARHTHLADWDGLQRWSTREAAAFAEAVRDFTGLPDREATADLERHEANLLLYLDLRPDDTLLVAGPSDWSAAREHVATLRRHEGPPDALLRVAADAGASVVIAPAAPLDRAAFRLAAGRLDLSRLRQIVALGGPLAANARARLYTWGKPDLMLLARAGDTIWGDPLSPVLRAPPPQPALGATRRSDSEKPRLHE